MNEKLVSYMKDLRNLTVVLTGLRSCIKNAEKGEKYYTMFVELATDWEDLRKSTIDLIEKEMHTCVAEKLPISFQLEKLKRQLESQTYPSL